MVSTGGEATVPERGMRREDFFGFLRHVLCMRPSLYIRTLDRSVAEAVLSDRERNQLMSNTVMPTTYLAQAADAAAWHLVRHTPAELPFRSGYDRALVERQMR
jgi:hypothetical protein